MRDDTGLLTPVGTTYFLQLEEKSSTNPLTTYGLPVKPFWGCQHFFNPSRWLNIGLLNGEFRSGRTGTTLLTMLRFSILMFRPDPSTNPVERTN